MSKPEKKLFLLDAMALIYRAHFAFSRNPRVNSKGMNTGAAFGFTNSMLEIIQKQKPTHLAVAFDTSAPTFRHESYGEYKANRQSQPEDITVNIPYIKQIIEGFNVPILEMDGFEADDLIGTIAKRASKEGFEVFMMTPDKDFAQLVEENIYLYKPAYMGNGVDILGVEEVKKKFDIEHVDQVRDILGLHGDASDNIPGIPGVGAKTAVKYLKMFGSVENLVKNVDQLKGKQKENVENFGDQGIMSKELATIKIDVPIEFNEKELTYEEPDKEKLAKVFTELEFRTLLKRVFPGEAVAPAKKESAQLSMFSPAGSSTQPAEEEEEIILPEEQTSHYAVVHNYHGLKTAADIDMLVNQLKLQKYFSFEIITEEDLYTDAEPLGLAISYFPGEAYFMHEDDHNWSELMGKFSEVLVDENIEAVGQNVKLNLLYLKRLGLDLKGFFDNGLAHYLIDPETSHSLEVLAENELNYKMLNISQLLLEMGLKRGGINELDERRLRDLACERADKSLELRHKLDKKLSKNDKLRKLYEDVEKPLLVVLADMEFKGVSVDIATLEALSQELEGFCNTAESRVFELAGEEFNLASPKQLGDILFDKLKLVEKPKKTKTGQYATGEEILSKLADDHEIVQQIMDFRVFQKLKTTYVDALPKMISGIDSRIHTDYRQTVAATGRLSSNNPNLQNIPIRTDKGREIRKAFVPSNPDHWIVSADYSQIELRIMASFAEDEHMIEAFRNGRDIHTTTAAKVFKVKDEEVDANMRRMAKSANFGIIYGISAFGLSQNLNIPRSEAKEIIEAYFTEFPSVKQYMDSIIEKARKEGYVETITGRRRYLRDINSRNATIRGYAERNAINAPMQGSAADIIKIAMISIQDWMQEESLKSSMVMQVHDELVFEVFPEELDLIMDKIPDLMKNASDLAVPMEVEIGKGKNWLEAH